MAYRHSGPTVDFGDGRLARAVLRVAGGSGELSHDGHIVNLGEGRLAIAHVSLDENGDISTGEGIAAISEASDAAIADPLVGYQMRYAVNRWRESLPGDLHLWDYILDQLNGSAYSASHRLFGLSITSGQATLTSQTDQFTDAMVGRTIRVDQAGSGGGVLSTTISAYTNARSVTLADNAASTVSLKGVGRIRGTDVSEAFDAWMADLGTRRVRGVMPGGTFNLSGNHEIPDDAWIEGSGHTNTILMLVNGVSADTDVLRTNGFAGYDGNTGTTNGNRAARGFGLTRFMIDGDFRSNANGRFGLAAYAFDWYMREVLILGCKDSALYSACNMTSGNTPHQLGTGPGGIHTYLHRIMVGNSADSGRQMQFLGPHDSYVQGLDIYKDGSYSTDGLYIGHTGVGSGVDGGGGSQFSDIHVWGNHEVGVNVASGGTLIDNLQSEGGNLQLRIAAAKVKITHARLYGVTGTGADEGLEMASGSDNMLTDLKIEDCDVAAVRFTGGQNYGISGRCSSDSGTPPPLVVGTPHATAELDLDGTAGYDRSLKQRSGHAVVAGDFGTFSSTWGSSGSPSIAVATRSNVYRGNATVTAGGATGIGANPTVVLTFPKAFTSTPFVLAGRSGTGTGGSSGWTVDNVSTTSARFTYAGTPTATASYSFSWMIME